MTGTVWKFGDNIDTDLIIPSRWLVTSDPGELSKHCMEDLDPLFAKGVQSGDIIVAGENFGCGSSREHAPLAIKGVGISCVIAKSFARIFYRNAFNIGLLILECSKTDDIRLGDQLRIEVGSGEILSLRTGNTFRASPIPSFMRELIEDGGLVPHISKQLGGRGAAAADHGV